ncbi:nucleoside triphosphate pyrophosphatase [Mucilaginibacter sp. L3T2-6]|uniref:Maf family protein n=1 Tax=Mucilaginibacter sp. L3T2-6 TaxID=3062491 RepID=UPI0026753B9A|nr:Maf family nucleotide pyrophosphatase [Mucilaginibacter sp. L3T2-6]MDO3642661.1 Maf family nucleotide pyrophosphatase [Mucilaginibacter sp. L3T2-6]MDV6217779.1 Maf family nucleotide pyrophosphatase [Mucilaginibacter sp. L3T2-6]
MDYGLWTIDSKMNSPRLILASKSPRRQELLRLMDIDFRIVLKDVDESYPDNLTPEEVAVYIAAKKAKAFDETLTDEIVLTADTIVCIDDQILGKPTDAPHAVQMLQLLSGRMHRVITGVCLLRDHQYHSFYDVSEVYFGKLSDEEIHNYVEKYQPFDKAGSYGIQERIGLIGIERINGSYTNVVGLPTEKLYKELANFR